MTSIYNKDLKNDSVKMQIIQEYYGNNKSSYEISRELGIPARTIQNFLAKDTHKGWHLENEEIIDKYFNGFGNSLATDCPTPEHQIGIWSPYKSDEEDEKLVNKAKHLVNIEKAKKFYDASRSALVSGGKMIRIPSQYLEEDVSMEDAEVLDYFVKIMENLEKCQENGILFIGMSQQEITNLIESIRSGVQVFTDKEGNALCIDEIYEDRLTFKIERDELDDYEDKIMDEIARGRGTSPRTDYKLVVGSKSEVYKVDKQGDNSRVLILSDIHFPYQHKDLFKFLQHLKDKYNPTRVICMGDETDGHALSFHDSDPDLPSAGDELRRALPFVQELYKMFPEMDILDSNHGSLVYRKAKHHGVPKHYIKSYNDVLGVGDGWKWSYDLTIDLPNGTKCYFHHGKSPDVVKLSQVMGMSAVQGHYHSVFKVDYWANPNGLYFGMQTGCLVDRDAYAFAYENCNLKKPIIGTGLIIDSHPILEPLIMDGAGNWIQR